MTTFTATKVTVLVMNALFTLTRKVYPYTAVQFVQLLAINYLKFKVTSLTAMAVQRDEISDFIEQKKLNEGPQKSSIQCETITS